MAEDQGRILYSWDAAEFQTSDRGRNWHWWTYGVALVVTIALALLHQWMLIAVLVMGVVVLWLLGRMKPREFKHTIANQGIMVGDRLWLYADLRSFWIVNTPTGKTLRLSPARKYAPGLTLQLGKADVEMVRTALSSYLPEESDRDEDLVDRVGRFLRF